MARKPLNDEQKAAARERLALARAAKQQKQTETPKEKITTSAGISFSQEQFDQLIAALSAGRQEAPKNAFTDGLKTNARGQIVGTKELYNSDPNYYPDPRPEIEAYFESSDRLRRFGFSYNYHLEWNITTKPYETKDGYMQREPTFHITLYATLYDDNGEDTGKFRVVQAMMLNEDNVVAIDWAVSQGIEATDENMKEIMDKARFERIKRWLLSVFFTENNYGLAVNSSEEVIDGQVVKVVTKSNVQGFNPAPKISNEELQ